jgi:membrane carboxypeptidase/penicillin-binding protein PbpC
VYTLVGNRYQRCAANLRGHYPIAPMGIELGIWQGRVGNQVLPWLRAWDAAGNLLLSADERAEQEKQRAEQEKQRAEQEKQRAEQEKQKRERLEAFLRSQGFDPDHLPDASVD